MTFEPVAKVPTTVLVADEIVARMLKKAPAERLKLLRESTNPQAQFLWAILRNGFHYAAVHLADVADSAREIDHAIRWGFGQTQGPFELWQEAGWLDVAKMVQEDIDAGKALCNAPLPEWVFKGPVAEAGGVFTDLEGRRPGLATTSVLAAAPALHAILLDVLNESAE